jgi:hypothetical protein
MKTQKQLLHHRVANADADVSIAQIILREALSACWPIGSSVRIRIRADQKNLTAGKVVRHRPDGVVIVQLSTADQQGRPTIKRVHWSHVSHEN